MKCVFAFKPCLKYVFCCEDITMTNQEIVNYKKEYREWCVKNRYRYRTDECGDPISPTRSRKNPKDHAYCAYKQGYFGLHISRETPKKFGNALRRLNLHRFILDRNDSTEGNFQLSLDQAPLILPLLKIVKTKASKTMFTGTKFKKL